MNKDDKDFIVYYRRSDIISTI